MNQVDKLIFHSGIFRFAEKVECHESFSGLTLYPPGVTSSRSVDSFSGAFSQTCVAYKPSKSTASNSV